jgi:hypothetical protein
MAGRRHVLVLLAGGGLIAACAAPAATTGTPAAPAVAAGTPATPVAATGTPAAPAAATGTPAAPAPDLRQARFDPAGWRTDFTRASVPLHEISSGGPPRDGIPPIDRPLFVPVSEALRWLAPQEPVIHLTVGGETRAYPLQILIWHEIVNDTAGGVPVAVTFCPLCNAAIVFDRRLDGRTLDFGTTGNLRYSDLVMWDRQTESWWQQMTGEAIVGELTGRRLTMLPATIIAWAEFVQQYPRGQVLSRETGFRRDYGRNPYLGYDRIDQSPFLFSGPIDGRLPPMERVVAVSVGGEDVAYPFTLLRERGVVEDQIGGQPVVIFFQPGTASALDRAAIVEGRDAGAAAVYRPVVDGRWLRFRRQDGGFVDIQTQSRWTLLGRAVAGPLAGTALEPVVSGVHFWFAWAAFKPGTRVVR